MNIPVIIVHKGNSFYLSPVLEQIRLFNPENAIYLISDISKQKYPFVNYCNIEDYMDRANEFEKRYVHLSSNPYFYELICFQRWFIILDFVIQHRIEHFLCMDSDVLLYCRIDDTLNKHIGCDFTICDKTGPGCSLFNVDSLKKFCDYISDLYSEKTKSRLFDFYQSFIDKKSLGGFCDMIAFTWYQNDTESLKIIDISIPENGACFDACLTASSGFEFASGLKKIYWKDNLPYGKLLSDGSLVRFYCLHFQGRTKYSIYKYALDKNKVHRTDVAYTLKWMFSKAILIARLQGIKKAIKNPQILANFIKKKFFNK
ncbi:MAG: hypothetical protein LBS05_06675 [Tannerellaceae bacterium]|jgi:hypothetical protein|nr:hypothetical protein [Tannerellaceae bacterium]